LKIKKIYRRLSNIYRLILVGSVLHLALSATGADSSKVSFTGQHSRIKYTKNRQIKEASYTLKNNTNAEVTVKLGNVWLVRGKSEELLEKASFRYFQNNHTMKGNEIVLRPRQKMTVVCSFKPFTIYTGSIYTVRTEIYVGNEKYKAVSTFELYKLEKNDPNLLKNTDK